MDSYNKWCFSCHSTWDAIRVRSVEVGWWKLVWNTVVVRWIAILVPSLKPFVSELVVSWQKCPLWLVGVWCNGGVLRWLVKLLWQQQYITFWGWEIRYCIRAHWFPRITRWRISWMMWDGGLRLFFLPYHQSEVKLSALSWEFSCTWALFYAAIFFVQLLDVCGWLLAGFDNVSGVLEVHLLS